MQNGVKKFFVLLIVIFLVSFLFVKLKLVKKCVRNFKNLYFVDFFKETIFLPLGVLGVSTDTL